MDLIYKNDLGQDIGVLRGFVFDLAYGSSENDFEFKMPLQNHCCKANYQLYIENTEYGGIIDEINVDTKNQIVTYGGRTWHGVMENKVITPPSGYAYYIANGNVNDVISALLVHCGLSELFTVDNLDNTVIYNYKFERYTDLYAGISKMLKEYSLKMRLRFDSALQKVVICVEGLHNYALDEEWDSDLIDFKMGINYNPTNHLICLGSGELVDRKVIHLFTDGHGNIQNYYSATCPIAADGTPQPLNDSHYNLTTSNMVLVGSQEKALAYEYTSNEPVETYVELTDMPEDWEKCFDDYYYMTEDGNYAVPEETENEVYNVLNSKPYDWDTNYNTYYDNDHNHVETTTYYTYENAGLTQQPPGWESNYINYYLLNADGTYSALSGQSVEEYAFLTQEPSDWKTNYSNYYRMVNNFKQLYYPRPSFAPNKYYVISEGNAFKLLTSKPSDWGKSDAKHTYFEYTGTSYIAVSAKTDVVPTFVANKYYTLDSSNKFVALKSKPSDWNKTISTNKYYEYTNGVYKLLEGSAPTYMTNKYYKLSDNKFTLMNSKPSDWDKAILSNKYYEYTDKKYKVIEAKAGGAPTFRVNAYYYKYNVTVAPVFTTDITYYTQTLTSGAPVFEGGTYYRLSLEHNPPAFKSTTFYKKEIDNYKVLVENGVNKLKEAWENGKISSDIIADEIQYDVGDIVGAKEHITGIFVSQYITKKIITIEDNVVTIKYEIGG